MNFKIRTRINGALSQFFKATKTSSNESIEKDKSNSRFLQNREGNEKVFTKFPILLTQIFKLIFFINYSSQTVENPVDKLWISCGWTCGQLGTFSPLWIPVDKLASYPQVKSSYPQNYPHTVYRSGQQKPQISTVSTAPTIYKGSYLNLLDFFRHKIKKLRRNT